MASDLTECTVCCEPFNKTSRIQVACEYTGECEFSACKTCIKTYLVGISTDPNCMHCNKAWSDKFLTKNLGATFMKSEYSVHRKELLVQQQLARLAETMPAVEHYKQVNAITAQIEELNKQYKEASTQCLDAREQFIQTKKQYEILCRDSIVKREMHLETYNTLIKLKAQFDQSIETKTLLMANVRKLRHDIAVIQNGGVLVGEDKKELARKFIMPCPNDECRGFLSPQYKCELCEHHTCSNCFDLIGVDKEDAGHVCKPENIESANFIRKQSKPCPCCGTRISKIDGCDQMWCTQCKKAFSWNTGKIVTGTIHNPHFYQYQREHGGGVAPRNPGDVVCGGLPGVRDIYQKLNQSKVEKNDNKLFETILDIHRLQGHFNQLNVQPLRLAVETNQNFETERVLYIVKEIDRKELANKVFLKDKRRKIKNAILHICELFIAVGTDLFQQIILSEKVNTSFIEEIHVRVKEYDELRQYCNEHFKEISVLYSVCVPHIKSNWTSSNSIKYNAKGEIDNYILRRDEQERIKKEKQAKKNQEDIARYNEARRLLLLQQQIK